MSCESLEQPEPLQHLHGLFEKIHRYLKWKYLLLESANSSGPKDIDARHSSMNFAPILSASGSGSVGTSSDLTQDYRFGTA
jgi:hypothetical protein